MKKISTLILFLFLIQITYAQNLYQLKGSLKDTSNTAIIAATLKLIIQQDTISTISNLDGLFSFNNIKSSEFSIIASGLGYATIKRRYIFDPSIKSIVLDPIILKNDARMLNEVVVSGTPDVTIKEDTLEYKASTYKLRENATTEELVKKLPGIEVDRDGNITAQGKPITKIRINGKDFFGGDVKTATQQLPADLIEKLQVVDDYGDQANITGVKDGDPSKVLNLVIRQDKNKGTIIRGTVGAGNVDRYQSSVFAASFNNSQQLSFLGNLNNTNANIFNLVQTEGGGGRRGGGRMGGGNNGFGGAENNGLTDVKSFGINYRDEWSKKLTAYGSYSFTYNDNNVSNLSLQSVFSKGGIINNANDAVTNNINNNHRFNFNIEYKIDSLNYLKLIPNFNYGNANGAYESEFNIREESQLSSEGREISTTSNRTPNYGLEFLYNHRFGAAPRNLSINGDFNTRSNSIEDDVTNNSVAYTSSGQTERYQRQLLSNDNESDNYRLRISYTEPISATKFLEFNYTYTKALIENDRVVEASKTPNTDLVKDNLQSNFYEYEFNTNRFGTNYRVTEKKYNYTLGIAVQPTLLKGLSNGVSSNKTPDLNIFPTARFTYKFARTRELNISVDGRSNQPSYNQLQPVINNSNLQFPVVGNSNLEAEFSTRFNIRYNNFDFASGNVFFTNLSFNTTNNKIVPNLIPNNGTTPGVIQTTAYENADGFYTINGFYAFSKPFNEKKYVLSFRGFANYNNNISLLDGNKNIAKNSVLNQRINFQINPKSWLDITPSISYSWNHTEYSLNADNNFTVNTLSLSYDHKIYFTKTFLWGGSFDKNFNSGFNNTNANPFIINTFLEKQFFKGNTGALRLQAFDLLNQNTNISRTVTDNFTLDQQSNRLARYFMLTFTMKFQKFAGKNTTVPDFGGEQRRYRSSGND